MFSPIEKIILSLTHTEAIARDTSLENILESILLRLQENDSELGYAFEDLGDAA